MKYCKRGHERTPENLNGANCRICQSIRSRKFYEDNTDKMKQQSKDRYESKKDEINAQSRKYYQDNKEEISIKGLEYRLNNKEKIAMFNLEYRLNNMEKIKEYRKQYYAVNRDRILEEVKEWSQANRHKTRVYTHNYKQRNIEQTKMRAKKYKLANPEKVAASAIKRRARMTDPDAETIFRADVFNRDNWKCQICGLKVNTKLKFPHPLSKTLDHIVPLACGGKHVMANVQLAHLTCNTSKQHLKGGDQLRLF